MKSLHSSKGFFRGSRLGHGLDKRLDEGELSAAHEFINSRTMIKIINLPLHLQQGFLDLVTKNFRDASFAPHHDQREEQNLIIVIIVIIIIFSF